MIRLAVLLTVSTFHAACSAEKPTGNSIATGNVNIAAAREADRVTEPTMTAAQIIISSDRGRVTAEVVDNEATRALLRMLPLTIEMRDHLGQEKTGNLPSPLPEVPRQTDFSAGTLGLWGDSDFVIYHRNGLVPEPGIIVLGKMTGDVSIFEGAEAITVRLQGV